MYEALCSQNSDSQTHQRGCSLQAEVGRTKAADKLFEGSARRVVASTAELATRMVMASNIEGGMAVDSCGSPLDDDSNASAAAEKHSCEPSFAGTAHAVARVGIDGFEYVSARVGDVRSAYGSASPGLADCTLPLILDDWLDDCEVDLDSSCHDLSP